MSRLLLISNSTNPGGSYLGHCASDLTAFLDGHGDLAFVPYALHDLDGYATQAERRFAELGLRLRSVHREADPAAALSSADGVFVGGGNTFRLLARAAALGLLDAIRAVVRRGGAYVGTSAGTNLACPTIRTTNDMPIVEPPSFDALGLVPFQVNPHYVDRDPDVAHGGETREDRIREFHEENDAIVVGLREGAMLHVEGDTVLLRGSTQARIFSPGAPPTEAAPGSLLDWLLPHGGTADEDG